MGYQALLFCPDEKLASVVSQVFSELDFAIDAVHEPFAAVKKLMSQRFDAIVVDSENEQNASLLFKSARNSSSNQSSLAIALVEGQMGVAKAYRIGANLVLTKPINVEQAKGTLRVARGLLRKNSDAAAASASSPAVPTLPARTAATPAKSFQASQEVATIAPPPQPEMPEVEADLAVLVAEDQPAVAASAAPLQITIVDEPTVEAAPAPVVPAQKTNPRFASALGSAAAPAPARNLTPAPGKTNRIVESKPVESKPIDIKPIETKAVEYKPHEPPSTLFQAADDDSKEAVAAPTFGWASSPSTPSFAALGDTDSEGAAGKKKVMIAAVVILALAALGYVGYETFNKPTPTARPVAAPQDSSQPALRPMSAPDTPSPSTPSGPAPSRATSATAPKTLAGTPHDKPSAGTANSSPIRIASAAAGNSAADSPADSEKVDPKPLLVKSNRTKKQSATADESVPQPPSVMAAAPNGDSLSGLMSSSSPALPKAPVTALRVSQGVSQGLLIKRVKPVYPQAALAIHAQGAVQIEATVSKEGKVINPKVLSGESILAQAALDAVRQWRYKPYYLDGEPVEIKTQITVNFKTN
ncbi:MAG: TonB family protein [Terriglobales bacterium]